MTRSMLACTRKLLITEAVAYFREDKMMSIRKCHILNKGIQNTDSLLVAIAFGAHPDNMNTGMYFPERDQAYRTVANLLKTETPDVSNNCVVMWVNLLTILFFFLDFQRSLQLGHH